MDVCGLCTDCGGCRRKPVKKITNITILCLGVLALAMSALGQKQTCAVQLGMSALPPIADICSALAHVRLCANSGHDDVKRAFENALPAGESLVTRPHYLSGAAVVFEEPSGAGCIPGGDWPCGLSGGAPPVPVSIGPVQPCGCFWPFVSGTESGYGQCCIRVCLYLNPPPALKSQNWRYRLGRSRCMQNAFVALARYRDNMERTHRFQSELPKAIAKTVSALCQ